jgi:transposase InsO family protein
MVEFIDKYRGVYGVGPICKVLPIAPSIYYEHKKRQTHPETAPLRVRRDLFLREEIKRVFEENFRVYGARKVWRQLNREGIRVAKCTVERLMRAMGLQGAVRGKKIRTTVPNSKELCPLDLVNRTFYADRPNRLWVADFTYVATWKGFVYVAFVIDVFARMIVGWRVLRTMCENLTLDALEQALWARKIADGLIHHSDRGSQYLSIKYSERLTKAGIDPSVGSVGDSYDNALAESIIGLFKTEVINRRGPWRTLESVEYATLEWVDWFNNRRLLEPIGNIPPAEAEAAYYQEQDVHAIMAGLT